MSDLEYREKYLKYKTKYINLKNKIDEQDGGFTGTGDYIFFFPGLEGVDKLISGCEKVCNIGGKKNIIPKINVNDLERLLGKNLWVWSRKNLTGISINKETKPQSIKRNVSVIGKVLESTKLNKVGKAISKTSENIRQSAINSLGGIVKEKDNKETKTTNEVEVDTKYNNLKFLNTQIFLKFSSDYLELNGDNSFTKFIDEYLKILKEADVENSNYTWYGAYISVGVNSELRYLTKL